MSPDAQPRAPVMAKLDDIIGGIATHYQFFPVWRLRCTQEDYDALVLQMANAMIWSEDPFVDAKAGLAAIGITRP